MKKITMLMEKIKIIIEINGEIEHFWFIIATPKEIDNLKKKLDEVITRDSSWVGESYAWKKLIK